MPSEVITQALKTQKKYSLGRNVSKVASTEVGLATILWTTTEADNQSSLHYAVRLTGSHLTTLDVEMQAVAQGTRRHEHTKAVCICFLIRYNTLLVTSCLCREETICC